MALNTVNHLPPGFSSLLGQYKRNNCLSNVEALMLSVIVGAQKHSD